jgi:chaperone modulatory protein CbpM
MAYAIVHVSRGGGTWPLARFAAAAGMDPYMIIRLVRLGLLEATVDATGAVWVPATQLARAAAIARLRTGLGLNYTAVGVVLDLLDRIDDLQQQLRTRDSAPRR